MTDRDYVAEIMEARGDLPLPTPVDAVLFLITEMGEYIDATLRQKPEYERNNAKAHTPEEELGDMWHMINVVRHVGMNGTDYEHVGWYRLHSIAEITRRIVMLLVSVSFGTGVDEHHMNETIKIFCEFSDAHHNLSADDIHEAAIAKLQRRKPAPDYVTCGCGRYNSAIRIRGDKWMCMECYREAMKEGAA